MLFYLQEQFRGFFGPLNVLRYPSFRVIAAFVTSFLICVILYPFLIKKLQAKKIGQVIREDVPERHLPKTGTPTMGGSLIVFSVLISTLLWTDLRNHLVWLSIALIATFGLIGFFDDYKKLKATAGKGLRGKTKLTFQFLSAMFIMGIFFIFVANKIGFNFNLYIPFVRIDYFWIELPLSLYFILACIIIVGVSNAVNLTDGLDGLAISPVIIATGTFLIFAYITGAKIGGFNLSKYLLIPNVKGTQELSVFCSTTIGAGIAFLWYNTFPAQVFLGDTGSLSLGASLGGLAIFTKNEILSIIILGIFVFESISVITQTISYKLTGKRIFKMAPYHHSLELQGWPEPKIVVRFWIISILLALFALSSIKIR